MDVATVVAARPASSVAIHLFAVWRIGCFTVAAFSLSQTRQVARQAGETMNRSKEKS